MDISKKRIKRAIGIDHPSVNAFIGIHFNDDEEALKAVHNGNFEIVNHCDRSDVGDIYNDIKTSNYKAYPLQNLSYNCLVVINEFYYYLVEFEKTNDEQ
ncbi:hypothetical protein [Bacillus toyonensis]|uniref:hypothetical protein n=1 Tax=Bacillus toyonensis TaxID=155322 RepID=UPI002E20AA24|nr:hypothetical protein [Bacillus toyonensis]